MATVKAFIRTSTGGKDKPVNVRFRLSDGRNIQLFHKSEITVTPDRWDEKQQKIKARCVIDETQRKEFDTVVDNRKAIIKSIYLEKGKAITSDMLDAEVEKALNPELYEVKPQTLFQFTAEFIETAPDRKDRKTGRLLSYNNIQNYRTTEKHLKAFAKSIRKKDFLFSEIDKNFYDKFVSYLQTHKVTIIKDGKPEVVTEHFTQNTVGKQVRNLKLMLNDAQAKGICNIPDLQKNFYVFREDVDTIYLSEKELNQLKNTDFSKTPYLDRVRDWFLLLAWTGCRFSDLGKIAKTDIKDGIITFRQQKTNEPVEIPLYPVVIEILEKYDYNLPTEISNQRFNEYVKEVCKIAKLNSKETRTRTVGGKLKTETFEKWQLVSSHTGRRSFCTNMFKMGVPTLTIMAISGHTTETAFLGYIKVTKREHAEIMKKIWADRNKNNV
ncbi:MAG: site-specific integrase [Bacteroidales bacterium]|nr:site-specific integrase [Bacteroidales bacterium]